MKMLSLRLGISTFATFFIVMSYCLQAVGQEATTRTPSGKLQQNANVSTSGELLTLVHPTNGSAVQISPQSQHSEQSSAKFSDGINAN